MANFFESFDEATKTKLLLYEKYIGAFLGVFINTKGVTTINVVDFFAGAGKDGDGTEGSPLIALKTLKHFEQRLKDKGVRVNLILNEGDKNNYEGLRSVVNEFGEIGNVKVETHNRDFDAIFDEIFRRVKGGANLVFIDQFGVKFVTPALFSKLSSLPTTDVLFFIASNHLKRFNEHPEIKKYIDIPDLKTLRDHHHAHRKVTEYFRAEIKKQNPGYFVLPFSLKKGNNIYGLIYGCNHPLGAEKFLTAAWKINSTDGDANFDIDGAQMEKNRPTLFAETRAVSKADAFKSELQKRIMAGELTDTGKCYIFALESGCLPRHVKEELEKMAGENLIEPVKFTLSGNHKKPPAPITRI